METIAYPRILKLPHVCDLTGLSKSAVYRKAMAGLFPKPVKISDRSSGWIEQEVLAWIKARIEESRG